MNPMSLSLSLLDSSLKPFLLISSPSTSSRRLLSSTSVRCAPHPHLNNNNNNNNNNNTFLCPLSLSRLHTLSAFSRTHHLPPLPLQTDDETDQTDDHPNRKDKNKSTLLIRPMLHSEIHAVSTLLADSFIETLFLPPHYARFLAFLVKNYLLERTTLLPHTALLVGILLLNGDKDGNNNSLLACTAEISFDQRGANASSPTPLPPPDCPYICNMTVAKSLRRRGIGKLLLQTCEDLISQMTHNRDVYLHCRMVDKVPLTMYNKAGYRPVKTDSFLVWLTLQRRKYLMRKTLLTDHYQDAPKTQSSDSDDAPST